MFGMIDCVLSLGILHEEFDIYTINQIATPKQNFSVK